MANKRISKRIPLRSIVKYGPNNPPQNTSIIVNISETGVCIKTTKVFAPGTKLFMAFDIGARIYNATGVVVWAKKAPPDLVRFVKNGMGIRFTDVDPAILKAYGEKTHA
jgi:Tfp pilus assembly protein PilZ